MLCLYRNIYVGIWARYYISDHKIQDRFVRKATSWCYRSAGGDPSVRHVWNVPENLNTG